VYKRQPQGPRKSAEAGAELRAEVIDVIDEVEARTGSYAFVFGLEHVGGTEQVLMVSSAFTEALDAHPRGELLQPAFGLMLTTAPVSYTHLDVYKRQSNDRASGVFGGRAGGPFDWPLAGGWPV